jgi:hypothetical protein
MKMKTTQNLMMKEICMNIVVLKEVVQYIEFTKSYY